ncbi:integrin beta-6 isoform X2 [Nematostella vectensis]|uniref:integrin beta-6 isoform X2 n=1 Tax=Nematostella vectensis TaxID=45351 RepID=UPI0020776AA2|nr:integrin beta-6 isoform X2 [Nematostella vectensis]
MSSPCLRFVLLLVETILLTPAHGQLNSAECLVQGSCKGCIAKPQCAWCYQEDFTELGNAVYRCDTKDDLVNKGCKNISNPSTELTNIKDVAVGAQYQVSPQQVKVKLRPGAPARLRLTVRPAENYPVDLYYLMDMSWSMRDDLSKLKGLAGKIAESMANITTKFRLGFGSFVDKTVMPYVQPDFVDEPCRRELPGACVATYGFKHILSLVNNSNLFEDEVNKQVISGNIDDPEGGFDALMQVAVCEEKIGWLKRGTSRRLVVFVSDDSFHFAGDGKLGGIVTPNDEQCHLNGLMTYDKSNEMDYPTLAQLHHQLQMHQIQPIFAVTRNVSNIYKVLSTMWGDIGAVTGELALDSRNVVDLIQESYDKIASTVKLSHSAPSEVKITYTARCGNQILNQKECTNVGIGEKVYFDLEVGIERCNKDLSEKKMNSFPVRVPGFGTLTVQAEYVCQCECEGPGYKEENSSRCTSGNGTYACGQCACHHGRYGERCECDSPFDKAKDVGKCKMTNSSDEQPCSGQGQCVCGRCVCNQGHYGEKCKCSDATCQKYEKQLCGGPERGACVCGECKCESEFLGSNCGELNCAGIQHRCHSPGSPRGVLCSGSDHGTCTCGQCTCTRKYSGKYCEECPSCEGGICRRSEDCLKCVTADLNSLEDCKKLNRCEPVVKTVSVQDEIIVTQANFKCEAGEGDCSVYYTYSFDGLGKRYDIIRQRGLVCPRPPPPPPILQIVLGVIAGILLSGVIALLAWKAYVTRMDKKEVEAFMLERTRARWQKEKSPLYKAPTTTFTNPAYASAE